MGRTSLVMASERIVVMIACVSSAIPSTVWPRERDVDLAHTAAASAGQTTDSGQATYWKTLARIAGVLLIVATVTSVIGGSLADPVVGVASHLATISEHRDRVIAGAALQLIAAFSSVGIAVALYPVVRRHDAALALGSAGFRMIEATLSVVGVIGTLLLLKLGQEYAHAADPSSTYFQTTGALLRTVHDDAFLTATLAFYLGGGLYYYAFYRSRMLPRWLSAWGLAGVGLGTLAGLCVLLAITTLQSTLHTALNVPIGVQEMVLAIWLITRGFGPPARPEHPLITDRGTEHD